MIINPAKEQTELIELTSILPTSFNYPLGSVISICVLNMLFKPGGEKQKTRVQRKETVRENCIGFECLGPSCKIVGRTRGGCVWVGLWRYIVRAG